MRAIVALACTLTVSCAVRRPVTAFRVLPGQPDYLLRSPDSKETPFPEVLSRYTNVGPGWVELRPLTELRVENAYFREGAPKHGLANFLGTEIARYQVLATGELKQISVDSRVEQRPSDQPPVQQLLTEAQRLYHNHRYFYQVLLSKKSNVRSAVLLGAESTDEMERLTTQLLTEPGAVCGDGLTQCTVFPAACTVSLEIEVIVNGTPRTVLWGSVLAEFAESHRHVALFRHYQDGLAPVEIDVHDREALRVPLLPGDVIKW
ncbi:MAG TPA: hypothetical protein VK335_10690 [Bryobacteraceae bacterium]|nr:hypothetical protein [Bryobacteraceae bacterium]